MNMEEMYFFSHTNVSVVCLVPLKLANNSRITLIFQNMNTANESHFQLITVCDLSCRTTWKEKKNSAKSMC